MADLPPQGVLQEEVFDRLGVGLGWVTCGRGGWGGEGGGRGMLFYCNAIVYAGDVSRDGGEIRFGDDVRRLLSYHHHHHHLGAHRTSAHWQLLLSTNAPKLTCLLQLVKRITQIRSKFCKLWNILIWLELRVLISQSLVPSDRLLSPTTSMGKLTGLWNRVSIRVWTSGLSRFFRPFHEYWHCSWLCQFTLSFPA